MDGSHGREISTQQWSGSGWDESERVPTGASRRMGLAVLAPQSRVELEITIEADNAIHEHPQ